MLTQLLAELGNYKQSKFHEKQDNIISDVDFQGLFTLCEHLGQYAPTKIFQETLIQMFNQTFSSKHACYFSIFFRAAIIFLMTLSEKCNVIRPLVGYGGSKWHNNSCSSQHISSFSIKLKQYLVLSTRFIHLTLIPFSLSNQNLFI